MAFFLSAFKELFSETAVEPANRLQSPARARNLVQFLFLAKLAQARRLFGLLSFEAALIRLNITKSGFRFGLGGFGLLTSNQSVEISFVCGFGSVRFSLASGRTVTSISGSDKGVEAQNHHDRPEHSPLS